MDAERLFDHVHVYDCPNYHGKVDYALDKIREIVNIESCMNAWLHTRNADLKSYDVIYMSLYTRFSYGMRELNPNSEVIFFEDGVGTYLGKEHAWGFEARQKAFKLLGKRFPDLAYSKLLVNNLEFYRLNNPESRVPVESIPGIDVADKMLYGLLSRVFLMRENSVYRNKRIVYLSEPNDSGMEGYYDIERSILHQMDDFSDQLIVRLHPRQKETDYGGYVLDRDRMLWELVILQGIDDKSTLVASFSTAQLIPKLLYGLEPNLIFVYPIYERDADEHNDRLDDMVGKIRMIYSDGSKVHIAQQLSDVKSILKAITGETIQEGHPADARDG